MFNGLFLFCSFCGIWKQCKFHIPSSLCCLSFLLDINFLHSLERHKYCPENTSEVNFILQFWLTPLLPSSFETSFLYTTIQYKSILQLMTPCHIIPFKLLFLPLFLSVFQPLNTFQFQMKITIRFYYCETFSCTDKNLIMQNKARTISLAMRFSCSFLTSFQKTLMTFKKNQFSRFFVPILFLIFLIQFYHQGEIYTNKVYTGVTSPWRHHFGLLKYNYYSTLVCSKTSKILCKTSSLG